MRNHTGLDLGSRINQVNETTTKAAWVINKDRAITNVPSEVQIFLPTLFGTC